MTGSCKHLLTYRTHALADLSFTKFQLQTIMLKTLRVSIIFLNDGFQYIWDRAFALRDTMSAFGCNATNSSPSDSTSQWPTWCHIPCSRRHEVACEEEGRSAPFAFCLLYLSKDFAASLICPMWQWFWWWRCLLRGLLPQHATAFWSRPSVSSKHSTHDGQAPRFLCYRGGSENNHRLALPP